MSYRVGIICPSEIAFRRFLPSIKRVEQFEFVGVAIATPEEWTSGGEVTDAVIKTIESEHKKAQTFVDAYGGQIYNGYQQMIDSPGVDVVYLPLPPALHFHWAKKVLEAGKHAYVEKPFTTDIEDTRILLNLASENNLAVHENYMFVFHKQIDAVNEIISSGEIGKVRQYRITFGFPRRAATDFRYNKALGGGALLDAGGYCMKYASLLLGDTARLVCANACYESEWEVDIFGSATMVNDKGIICQMSFGMDCDYRCDLEAWGSTGTLTTGRILTAPDGFEPEVIVKHNQDYTTVKLPADNAFENSIRHFYNCLTDKIVREKNFTVIERQSKFVSEYKTLSQNGK